MNSSTDVRRYVLQMTRSSAARDTYDSSAISASQQSLCATQQYPMVLCKYCLKGMGLRCPCPLPSSNTGGSTQQHIRSHHGCIGGFLQQTERPAQLRRALATAVVLSCVPRDRPRGTPSQAAKRRPQACPAAAVHGLPHTTRVGRYALCSILTQNIPEPSKHSEYTLLYIVPRGRLFRFLGHRAPPRSRPQRGSHSFGSPLCEFGGFTALLPLLLRARCCCSLLTWSNHVRTLLCHFLWKWPFGTTLLCFTILPYTRHSSQTRAL